MHECRAYYCIDEHGKVTGFVGSIGDELKQRGVIWQDRTGQWRIDAKNANVVEDRYRELACCDFCTSRPVVWDVECEDFIDALGNDSMGGWAACQECGDLVRRQSTKGLLERTIAHSPLLDKAIAREVHIANLREFWKHYRGIRQIAPRPFGH